MELEQPPIPEKHKFDRLYEKMINFVTENKDKIGKEKTAWLCETYDDSEEAHKVVNMIYSRQYRSNLSKIGILQVSKMGNKVYIKIDISVFRSSGIRLANPQ